jgi:predicted metalloprotease
MGRPGRTKIREPALRMGVVVLLASLVLLLATACGGSTRSTPPAQDGNTEDLQNPTEEGEKVLANLPEVNPPLAGSHPKIVGSQNMTTQQFAQTIGADINNKWRAVFEEAGYAYSNAKFLVYN